MNSNIQYNPFIRKIETLPIIKQSREKVSTFFISSTFSDMQVERDELMYRILPQIKAFARQYGRRIEFCDYRWGIDTRIDKNKSISICIEAATSSDYFIGLLGDNYGWVPDEDILRKELSGQITEGLTGKSITALEIEFGAMKDLSKPGIFYLRYPSKTDFVGKDKQFELAGLKNAIYESRGSDCKNYGLPGDIHEEFKSETVISDIQKLLKISAGWGQPHSEPNDDYQADMNVLDNFCHRCSDKFQGRKNIRTELLAFATNTLEISKAIALSGVENETQIILLYGGSGTGKSALMCKVMKDIPKTCLLLPFSCGLSPSSSHVEGMLRFFIHNLNDCMNWKDDSKKIYGFKQLKERFFELLDIVSENISIVAIIDALDQLSGDETNQMLWISGKVPKNFRLIISCADDSKNTAVERLHGKIVTLPDFLDNDIRDMVEDMLEMKPDRLFPEVVDYLLSRKTFDGRQAAQNPLYLSLMVMHLMMFNRFEFKLIDDYRDANDDKPSFEDATICVMEQRIEETPPDAEGAYISIVHRMEQLIRNEDQFVKGVLCLIAASRFGLREEDIKGAFLGSEIAYSTYDFGKIIVYMNEHFFVGEDSQWDFSHENLRRAIWRYYKTDLRKYNDYLIDFWKNECNNDEFANKEIMHHLNISNRAIEGAFILTDTAYLKHAKLYAKGLADIYRQREKNEEKEDFLIQIPAEAQHIGSESSWRVTKTYQELLLPNLPEATPVTYKLELMEAVLPLALCEGIDFIDPSIQEEFLPDNLDDFVNNHSLLRCLLELVLVLPRAYWQFLKTYMSVRAFLKYFVLADCSRTLADLSYSNGDGEKAEEYYDYYIDIARWIYRRKKTSECTGILSDAFCRLGDHYLEAGQNSEAAIYYMKSYKYAKKMNRTARDLVSLRKLALSIEKIGDWSLASNNITANYYKFAERFRRKIFRVTNEFDDLELLSGVINRQGILAEQQGKFQQAEKYFQEALKNRNIIYTQTGTGNARWHLSDSYHKMAHLLASHNSSDDNKLAEQFYADALISKELICEEKNTLENLQNIATFYNEYASYLGSNGYQVLSFKYFEKALIICDQIYGQAVSMPYMMPKPTSETEKLTRKAIEYVPSDNVSIPILNQKSLANIGLGDYYMNNNKIQRSAEYYNAAIEDRKIIYSRVQTIITFYELATAQEKAGCCFLRQGLLESAEIYFGLVIDVHVQICEVNCSKVILQKLADAYKRISNYYLQVENKIMAIQYLNKANEVKEKHML